MMTRGRHPIVGSLLALVCAILGTTSLLAEAPKRYALVIGNSDYHHADQVPNAARDAAQMAQSLSELRFQVIAGFNVDRRSFERLVAELGQQAADAGAESVVIYYAGHAVQLGGRNYLVPVDAVLQDPSVADGSTLLLDDILASVQNPLRQTIVFVDACRGNPGQAMKIEADEGGLARVEAGESTFIAFAGKPGSIGCDGGKASPFADALLTHIGKPGLSLADLMIEVRDEVSSRTLGRQEPWVQSSLRGDFHFNPVQPYRVASTGPSDVPVADRGAAGTANDPGIGKGGLVIGGASEPEADAPALRRLLPAEPSRMGAQGPDPVSEASTPGTPETAHDTPKAEDLALAVPPEPRAKPEARAEPDDLIRPLQEKLRKLGCYQGVVDGQWGPKSRNAVKRYHSAKGRTARSLEPGRDLLDSLEREPKTVCAPAKRTKTANKTNKRTAKARPARQAAPQPQHREQDDPYVPPTFFIEPHGGIDLDFGF
jgi:hypothetical protein